MINPDIFETVFDLAGMAEMRRPFVSTGGGNITGHWDSLH